MSELQQDNPFEAIGSEVVNALNKFDESRKSLYLTLNDVAATTPDISTYHPVVSPKISEVAESFSGIATAMRTSGDDIDAVKESVTALWLDDDNERVGRFILLAGGDAHTECFSCFGKDSVTEIVNDIVEASENDDDLHENLSAIFRASLAGDVEALARHVQARRAERIQSGEIEPEQEATTAIVVDLSRVQKHLVDVAKIAVGVTLGLTIFKRFSAR